MLNIVILTGFLNINKTRALSLCNCTKFIYPAFTLYICHESSSFLNDSPSVLRDCSNYFFMNSRCKEKKKRREAKNNIIKERERDRERYFLFCANFERIHGSNNV